jgi:hypothetical protein
LGTKKKKLLGNIRNLLGEGHMIIINDVLSLLRLKQGSDVKVI